MMNDNLEAEMQIIGTLLRYPEASSRALRLSAEHFHHPELAEIFQEIRKIMQSGESWNLVTFNSKTSGKYQKTIVSCGSYEVLNIEDVVAFVIELANRRFLIKAANDQLIAAENGASSQEIAAIARKSSDRVAGEVSSDFKTGRQLVYEIMGELEKDVKPIPTGIALLDNAMNGGMFPGEMYGLGGRKKTGKTMFAGTLSYNLSKRGVQHLYVAAEMGGRQIHKRVLARHLNVFPSAYKSGYAKRPEIFSEISYAAQEMPDAVYYCNAPGITLDRLKQVITAAVFKHNIEGVIIDYWQLIGGRGKLGQTEHLDTVAQSIADICKQFNIWNWTLSQINQDGNTRGGEGIRNACDMMFEMHREDKTKPYVWMEMMETRNTDWCNVGDADNPDLIIDAKGPFIRQIQENS